MRRPLEKLALAVALALAGCSIFLGKPYSQMPSVPQGMSVIYLYTGDITSLQTVLVDRTPHNSDATHSITMLKDSYYPYLATAGPVRILTTDGDEPACVYLETVSGLHYWVRIASADAETRRIEVVSKEVGEQEIAGHRKVSTEARGSVEGSYDVACPQDGAEGSR